MNYIGSSPIESIEIPIMVEHLHKLNRFIFCVRKYALKFIFGVGLFTPSKAGFLYEVIFHLPVTFATLIRDQLFYLVAS